MNLNTDLNDFTTKNLQEAKKILKKEFPNGPAISKTVYPPNYYDVNFNDFTTNIRQQLAILGKKLYPKTNDSSVSVSN